LIQKSTRPDSIVAHFYFTASFRRLLQQYLPKGDIDAMGPEYAGRAQAVGQKPKVCMWVQRLLQPWENLYR